MTPTTVTEKLEPLFEFLDSLARRASVADLHARLSSLDLTVDDVASYVRFGGDNYLRNLVREGRFYHALVMCWRSGQRSPIHNHAGSTCGLTVLQGVATETTFKFTPCALVRPVSSRDHCRGDTMATEDSAIHQVSNLQGPGEDLVTFHVYSPPLLRMDTYSLTDSRVGEFRPNVLEHALGSGI